MHWSNWKSGYILFYSKEEFVMPKVLIMSDSHGLSNEVTQIKDRHKNEVDHLIHCGDSELGMDSIELDSFLKVGGNTDFDVSFPDEEELSADGLTFFVTHGHLHQVKSTLMPLSYRAEELGAQVICFGHTHIAGVENIDKKLFINPGSIRLPRGREEKTYAIISWSNLDNVTVDFYEVSGIKVDEYTFEEPFK